MALLTPPGKDLALPKQRELLIPAPLTPSDRPPLRGEIVDITVKLGLLGSVLSWFRSVRRAAASSLYRARFKPVRQRVARIVAFVPAHNEEQDIARTLEALLTQSRKLDRIVVIADNCDDRTEEIASQFRDVTVMRTIANVDKKVGALSQAWNTWAHGYDFVLGVDADTVLAPDCVAELETEMTRNPNAAGVMARYTFDERLAGTFFARQLIRAQRHDFASWLSDIMAKNRETYVLGGQATLFRTAHLQAVADTFARNSPWDPDAQVEDMELTWRLHDLGRQTLVSTTARAYAGPMLTLKALIGQRRKWDEGMIELLRKTGFTRKTAIPWKQQAAILTDGFIRVALVLMLTAAVSVHQFIWAWIWAVPPLSAVVLNLKTAWRVPGRKPGDLMFALALFPAELWLWTRIWTTSLSWANVLFGKRRDGWEAQRRAESGQGAGSYGKLIVAFVSVAVAFSVLSVWWTQHASVLQQRAVLTTGWGALAALTLFRTAAIFIKILKPTKGYRP